ncbi:hypothetical protein DFH09DRAFT_1043577 [Mycena vulgaris]|nr:hypothetical protein DFH09DRAFT_1043577 [Mycena vulgaris]
MSQPSGRAGQLPAELQREIQLSAYVLVGCTAVLIWDVLNNLRNDYMLLFKRRFHVTSGAYVVSRLASLVYLLGFTIFFTHPIQACDTAFVAFNSFYPLVISVSTFLFLFRVRGVYGGDRLVTATFGFLWLIVVATSMTVPFRGNAIGFGDPRHCVLVNAGENTSVSGIAGIALAVYDTLSFFAISYRLVSNFRHSEELTCGEQVRTFFNGANLPAFSKALFTDGQMYYMITAATNCAAILLVYLPNTVLDANSIYHGVMLPTSMTVLSIMACRVYRNTKLRVWEPSLPTVKSGGPGRDLTTPLSVVFAQRCAVDSEGDASEPTGRKSGTAFSAGMHHDFQGAVRCHIS